MTEEKAGGIGPRLRATRERRGLTREALAYHSGISWSAVAQVESGRRINLRPGTLLALARALGVTTDYLLAGHVERDPLLEHLALFYGSDTEFLAGAEPFLTEGIDRSERVLVVAAPARADALRRRLGRRSEAITFAEPSEWHRTPATALDGYRRFVDGAIEAGASWVRILGETHWAQGSAAELRLLSRYEAVLDLTLAAMPLTLLCAYATTTPEPATVGQARAAHRACVEHGAAVASDDYRDPAITLLGE
jgi:transcriptional regulator with XRE-family HTH domain